MTDHTAPELIWVYDGSHGAWAYGGWDKAGQSDTNNRLEYIPRPEVDALVAAAQCLRDAQRAYMANRGNNDLGRQVGIRAEELDAALAAFTPTDSRAALRAHTEAAVKRALEAAINVVSGCDRVSEVQPAIRALDASQFVGD